MAVQQVHLQSIPDNLNSKMQRRISSLTKNYFITISMQKTSSIYQFILEIQHNLVLHELNDYFHFWPCPPENHWNNVPEFASACKSQFISPIHFWDKANFCFPWPEASHTFLITTIQKIFTQLLIFMNLCQHARNQNISSFTSPDIVKLKILAKRIFAHITRTRFFLNIAYKQEHSK